MFQHFKCVVSLFIRVVLCRISHPLINNIIYQMCSFSSFGISTHTHSTHKNCAVRRMCRYECYHLRFTTPNTSLHDVFRVYSNTHIIEHIFFFLLLRFLFTLHMCDCMRIATRVFFLLSYRMQLRCHSFIRNLCSQFERLRVPLTEFQYASEMVLLASILRFIFTRRSHLIRLSSFAPVVVFVIVIIIEYSTICIEILHFIARK